MTHIKIEAKHTGSEHWIEAGPDAFTVHVWALVHCDEQLTDGRISKAMAARVALPVPPERAEAAVEELLRLGIWETGNDGMCHIVDYESHALPASEVSATRQRWADDRRRRRKHGNGVHDECDPKKCDMAARSMSAPDSAGDSSAESAPVSGHQYYTRPDQTLPDLREGGSGSGMEVGAGARSAGAPRAPRLLPEAETDNTPDLSPWDISIGFTPGDDSDDPDHAEVSLTPALVPALDSDEWSAEQLADAGENFRAMASAVEYRMTKPLERLAGKHRCNGECRIVRDDDELCLLVQVPEAVGTAQYNYLADQVTFWLKENAPDRPCPECAKPTPVSMLWHPVTCPRRNGTAWTNNTTPASDAPALDQDTAPPAEDPPTEDTTPPPSNGVTPLVRPCRDCGRPMETPGTICFPCHLNATQEGTHHAS